MIPDKVIYTDGRDVTVTDTILKVKNTKYLINGITKMSLWTIKPHRWPGVLMILIGALAMLAGWFEMIPPSMDLQTQDGVMTGNTLSLLAGAVIFLIGVVVLALSRERYAVRIATAEGEKNAIISNKREYIAQIVDALNSAFNFGSTGTQYTNDTTGTAYIR